MEKKNYQVNDINDYKNKITEEQAQQLIKHCNKYNITPKICAWYDNMEDFYSDWCNINDLNFTKQQAKERYQEGKETGEFCKFKNGEIVRLVM